MFRILIQPTPRESWVQLEKYYETEAEAYKASSNWTSLYTKIKVVPASKSEMKRISSLKSLRDPMMVEDPKSVNLPPIRLSPKDYLKIVSKAEKYARGNISAYIRYVAINYEGTHGIT
jgi:hypothetical protein